MRKWRNEEMETLVGEEPWVIYNLLAENRHAKPAAWFSWLVVWPTRTIQLNNGWYL